MRGRRWGAATALALCAALAGCAADAYYERGQAWEARDPSAAAEYYRLCLEADPAHAGARDRLATFDFYGPLLAEARGAEGRKDWEGALRAYDRLAELGFVLRPLGAAPPEDLAARHAAAAREAAGQRYEAGTRAQAQGDDAAAARAFRECVALDPTHAEAGAAYRAARARAVRRVGIVPFDADAPADAPLARELADAVIAQVDGRRPELLELVTRTNLERILQEHDLNEVALVDPATAARSGKLAGLHVVVTARLSAVERGDPGWVEEPGQAEVERPGGQKVAATWVVRTRTTRAALTLNVQALDVESGAVLVAERVARERTSTARHARKTSGADEALPKDVAALCRAGDAPPKAPDDLARELVAPVADAAAAALVERLR